ncbi:MAG: winged helix-turn-helix transcriptional regulator [Acidobacteria bacterium]|nr:winged helix-turn-helix transcriptional regulator [Acidobacteriota bacterium]
MSRESARDEYAWRILTQVEAGTAHSQRSLARSTGIALGLTNLLLKRLVRKGLVRISRVQRNRVKYLITPAGIAEKARMSRAYFAYTTRFYIEARNRVRERFLVLSDTWPASLLDGDGRKRIVFHGAGEVAEIGHVCLHETDLTLVATLDGDSGRRIFGQPVLPTSWLDSKTSWSEFGVLVVMSFDDAQLVDVRARLSALEFPANRVFYI